MGWGAHLVEGLIVCPPDSNPAADNSLERMREVGLAVPGRSSPAAAAAAPALASAAPPAASAAAAPAAPLLLHVIPLRLSPPGRQVSTAAICCADTKGPCSLW